MENWLIGQLLNWRIDKLMKKNSLIIAIDGPAAVGKSTMGKLIARELGFLYIDTGAIYRAITWKVLKNNINVRDEDIISNLVSNICITIERANSKSLNNYYLIFVDGEDVTEEIRNPRIDQNVSQIARIPKISNKASLTFSEVGRTDKSLGDFNILPLFFPATILIIHLFYLK